MTLFDQLVERRIAEAMEAGAFDGLPGAGKPLALDDDRLVPEDLRIAYRMLRNAGFLPPEIDARREAAGLRQLLHVATHGPDGEAERRAQARLALLEATIEARGGSLRASATYQARLIKRLAR